MGKPGTAGLRRLAWVSWACCFPAWPWARRAPGAVPGRVEDRAAIPRALHPRRGGAIDLPAPQFLPAARGALHQGDGRVTSSTHGAERLGMLFGHPSSGEGHPRDVGKDRACPIELPPQVQKDSLVALDPPMMRRLRQT